MAPEERDDRPPGPISDEDEAGISTELPVVVLGDEDETLVSAEIPRVRLLPGRLHERWTLYPIYVLNFLAGALAFRFALGTHEWSAPVVGLAWVLLYVWNWFYGIAYRYRRRVLKYTSVFAILALTVALAYFSIERAAPQMAMVGPHELVERGGSSSLYWAAVFTMIAAGLLIVHLVFLGRGYRRKRSHQET